MSDTVLALNSLISQGLIITDIANCIKGFSTKLAAEHYMLRIAPLLDVKNRNIENLFLNLIIGGCMIAADMNLREKMLNYNVSWGYVSRI
jgi:hypothetical protein